MSKPAGEQRLSSQSVDDKRGYLRDVTERARKGNAVWTEEILQQVHAMAQDSEWPVRQDVAQLLVFLPEEVFTALAPALLEDANAYVKRAAEYSKQRKRQAHQEAKRASRGLDVFAEHYELFLRKHGPEVTAEAVRLGERRIELVTGALAHDLLNMLAFLQNSAHSVSQAIPRKNVDIHETAKELLGGFVMMQQSLNELLVYSEPITVEHAHENLRMVVRTSREMAFQALNERGGDYSVVVVDDSAVPECTISITLHLIVRALSNLIKNACETFEDKNGNVVSGRVTVAAMKRDENIEITIHNSGKGLTPEKLTALMAWLPASKNRNKKDSRGYGLLNAKKIVEEHGGTLTFQSQPNKGVTAIVTLPV